MNSMTKQEMKFEAEVKEKEVKEMSQQVKKDTQVVTNEELEKLLPIVAGQPIDKETNKWAEEVMHRQVEVGSVVQLIAMMLAPTKENLLGNQYAMLDTQDVFKRTLLEKGLVTQKDFDKQAKAIVKERDEAREKAQALIKEQLEENKKANSHPKKHSNKHAKKNK